MLITGYITEQHPPARKSPKDEKYLTKLGYLIEAYGRDFDKKAAFKYAKMEWALAKKLDLSEEKLALQEIKFGRYAYHIRPQAKKALGHLQNGYDIMRKIYGDDHLKTADALLEQGHYYKYKEKSDQAVRTYKHVLTIYQDQLPPDDRRVTGVHDSLMRVYGIMGDQANADKHGELAQPVSLGALDRRAASTARFRAHYPQKALRKKLTGYVIVEFTVDAAGVVKDEKVMESSHKIFNKPALSAMKQFRFRPAIRDGKVVETVGVLQKFTFYPPKKKQKTIQ